jgi:hypothetical protein
LIPRAIGRRSAEQPKSDPIYTRLTAFSVSGFTFDPSRFSSVINMP